MKGAQMPTDEIDFGDLTDDPDAASVIERLPSPGVLRLAALTTAAALGVIVGKDFDLAPFLEPLLDVYAVTAPVVLGLVYHRTAKPGKHAR